MKKIAIIGTAANPIHLGHIEIAKAVSEVVDEVWISPCWSHSFGKEMASPADRLMMCRLATQGMERIRTSSFEIDHQYAFGTYEFLKAIDNKFPGKEFYFVIGQDNADTIKKWINYEALIQEHPFIVVPRKGYVAQTEWYLEKPHIYLENTDAAEISSSYIRENINNTELVSRYLHPAVLQFIQRNFLYGNQSN